VKHALKEKNMNYSCRKILRKLFKYKSKEGSREWDIKTKIQRIHHLQVIFRDYKFIHRHQQQGVRSLACVPQGALSSRLLCGRDFMFSRFEYGSEFILGYGAV
jgi:hypothetical protein